MSVVGAGVCRISFFWLPGVPCWRAAASVRRRRSRLALATRDLQERRVHAITWFVPLEACQEKKEEDGDDENREEEEEEENKDQDEEKEKEAKERDDVKR